MSLQDSLPRARTKHVLFDRQRQLLALLDAVGGHIDDLTLRNLLFLYCHGAGSAAPYEFVPTDQGAFSFTAEADRRKLVERDLVADDDAHWRLTDLGRSVLSDAPRAGLSPFVQRYKQVRGNALVVEACRRSPYHATRIDLATHVLAGDAEALARIEGARPRPGAAMSTIGYEGRALENYLNELLRTGATVLCDVRRNPISRKYGFSKGTLGKACATVGIRYEHVPELGIASEQRQALETQADYDALFDEYERTTLPNQAVALQNVATWIRAGERVALTCYERLPQQCHRHCVSEALERELGEAWVARHL